MTQEMREAAGTAAARPLRRPGSAWDQAAHALRVTDAEGTILVANPAYCDLVGKPREAVEGLNFSRLYAAAEQDQALERHRRRFAARHAEPLFTEEITLWDGRKARLEFSNSFLEGDGGRPLLLTVIREVVVERREATRSAWRVSAADAAEQLLEAVRRLSAARALGEVIEIVKRAARRMTGADGAAFVLREGEQCYYADEDAVEPLWKGRRFPLDVCVSGWAMRHRQPAVIPDVFADARVPQDAYRPTFVRSLALVPIRALSPVGALGIYWRERCAPTPEAVRWLQSLADATALAVEHLQTRAEAQDALYRAGLLRGENEKLRNGARAIGPGDCVRMCFVTNRVEVDGEWLSVEAFLTGRFGLTVTHGLSPEGLARLGEDARVRR
jgi:PAS domain S-box-containing protein